MRVFPRFIEKQDFGNGVRLNYGWAYGLGFGNGYGFNYGSGMSYNNTIYNTFGEYKSWGNGVIDYPTSLIQYWL